MTQMLALTLAVMGLSLAYAQASDGPTVGQPAPDFSLPYATKDSIARVPLKLSDIIGTRNIILAFYPADWSSGCTREVCSMRDDFSALQSLNADVLGISGDYVFSHHEWAKHHNLPFRLLSDHLHEVAKAYNSYNEKTLMNKRTIFVIDRTGRIAYVDLAYSVATPESFNKLKEALAQIQ